MLENEKHFGIRIEDLLKVRGKTADMSQVYRKVEAIPLKELAVLNDQVKI
jgi:hypothetical protein